LWDLTWSLRRAVGGAFAAGVGWVAALSFARLVFPNADLSVPQPLFFAAAGAFAGAAGGLMERSSRLTVRGMAVGAAAGFLFGGFLRVFFRPEANSGDYFWIHMLAWAGVGFVLGWICGRIKPLEAAGGLLGGGLGGALSLNFSVAMALQHAEPGWAVARGIEFLAGAVLGAFLWGGIALTGRLALRRRWFVLPTAARS
jgi:hypothetical protein